MTLVIITGANRGIGLAMDRPGGARGGGTALLNRHDPATVLLAPPGGFAQFPTED